MADNPFQAQLEQLNGVTLGKHAWGTTIAKNTLAAYIVDGKQVQINYISDSFPNESPGYIYVHDTNYYTAHTLPGGLYVMPSFGRIFIYRSGGDLTGYIHGFGENGMILLGGSVYNTPQDFIDNGAFVLAINGLNNTSFPVTFSADPSVFCFAEGTRIETADGPVAVEDLTEGTLALTASGTQRPIRWIGQLVSRPARHKRPWEVNPVRILPHAFGPNIPEREVRLSPGHSVFVDGVLVPVAHLVNGATIVQDAVEAIRYFHVELDSHDVLLSEGLPCESYLNDRGRQGFVNAGEVPQLHARIDPQSWDDACAPLVVEGPHLTAIRARLHAQAEALGWALSDAVDVMLEVDGATLLPRMVQDGTFTFDVPGAKTVRLVSKAGVLAHVRPEMADRRMLGVAVTALAVAGQPVDLEDAVFGTGFHAVERQEQAAWRWSDGYATLDLALSERTTLAVTVSIAAPAWSRVPTELKRVA